MKYPFRINREHISNGYNSRDINTFADCYKDKCPYFDGSKTANGTCNRCKETEKCQ